MSGWVVLVFIIWTIVVAVVMFFVGGKWKIRVMKAAGLIKETAGSVVDTVKDAGKKL